MVVGDIYLDENVFGSVTGVSLEAPIPIYEVRERKYNPGAAGNAACNVAALGPKTYMIGYIGEDVNAGILRQGFAAHHVDISGVVVDPTRPSNTYGKLKAGGYNILVQEILRTDTPHPAFIEGKVEEQIIANIRQRAPEVDAIVVVDQVSSVATERVIAIVVECARKHKLLTVGDSRARAGALKGFDVLVPNDREAAVGVGIRLADQTVVDEATLHRAAQKLLGVCKNALITQGPHGITVFKESGEVIHVPVTILPSEVVDVTGAGDTATAAVTVTLVAGGTLEEAAYIANVAAGVAVKQPGVVTVPKAQLERALLGQEGPAKLKTLVELGGIVDQARKEDKRIVWTNGCFDLLHAGHIVYLQRAAAEGDLLVVGLNSDESVRQNKGPGRPVVPENERALILSALDCVDYLTIFHEPNTVSILEQLKPDVYAKGGDYALDTINQEERRVVESYGGAIAIIPGVEGYSTTRLINRIKSSPISSLALIDCRDTSRGLLASRCPFAQEIEASFETVSCVGTPRAHKVRRLPEKEEYCKLGQLAAQLRKQ